MPFAHHRLRDLCRLGVTVLAIAAAVQAQQQPGRPGLIRDTETAEGKVEADPDKPKEYNPLEAERNFRVGDFYFKRKNYTAAAQRYLEAIEYQPNLVKAYQALSQAYERKGDTEKARRVCLDFIQRNPDSPKKPEFESRLAKLGKSSN
jgi:tetratricopeptide (TPR) repeat protein